MRRAEMKEWLWVACIEDLPRGCGKSIFIEGKRFAVFHLNMGFFILDGRCCYPDGYLGDGKIDGNVVTCLQHGCRFNVVSGECLDNNDIQLGTYRVKTQQSDIFVQYSRLWEPHGG